MIDTKLVAKIAVINALKIAFPQALKLTADIPTKMITVENKDGSTLQYPAGQVNGLEALAKTYDITDVKTVVLYLDTRDVHITSTDNKTIVA